MPRELNLLPPQRRQRLTRAALLTSVDQVLRTILLGLGAITTVGLFIAALVPLVLTIQSSTSQQLQAYVQEYQQLRDAIAERNAMLEAIHDASGEQVRWSDHVPDVLAVIPPGTDINEMFGELDEGKLTITGTAPARGTLVVLENRLRLLPGVTGVEAPFSNLVSRQQPEYEFEITF